jgi:peroxiredoxin
LGSDIIYADKLTGTLLYSSSSLSRGKKVVIVSIPGCFTPTCHGNHVPPFLESASKFAEKGYEVYIISSNDPFVMSGFRTAQGAKGELHFATELDLGLSKALGATVDLSSMGFGIRGARYALVADDLKIKYFEVSCRFQRKVINIHTCLPRLFSFLQTESSPAEVSVTSAETVLGKL